MNRFISKLFMAALALLATFAFGFESLADENSGYVGEVRTVCPPTGGSDCDQPDSALESPSVPKDPDPQLNIAGEQSVQNFRDIISGIMTGQTSIGQNDGPSQTLNASGNATGPTFDMTSAQPRGDFSAFTNQNGLLQPTNDANVNSLQILPENNAENSDSGNLLRLGNGPGDTNPANPEDSSTSKSNR